MKRLLFAVLLLTACGRAVRPPGDPDSLQAPEIAASNARNAYELIERARPLWLVPRGDRSLRLPTVILVYQDGAKLGEVEVLKDLPLPLLRSIRVLDAAEAGRLPGLGSQHVERVLYITTIRR